MHRIVITALGVALAAWAATGATAAEVKITGQVRWRAETESHPRPLSTAPAGANSFALLRTRVGAEFSNSGSTRAFVQLQDARFLGRPNSGSLIDDESLGIHQAFLEVLDFLAEGLDFQAGRFEMNYGNQRLVGAVGWSNTGRAFDGVRVGLGVAERRVQLFATKLADRTGTRPDQDRNFYGGVARFKELGLEPFLFYDRDNEDATGTTSASISRFTAGTYLSRKQDAIDVNANVAFQFGKLGDTDLSAYLLAGEVGVTPEDSKVRLFGGVDYASGDDPDSDSFNAFNNLYYTGHKFRGVFDQFLASGPTGLLDAYGGVKAQWPPRWTTGATFHVLRAAQSFMVPAGEQSALGNELDVFTKHKVNANTALQLGGAWFMPDEAVFGDPSAPLWGYAMVTVGF